MKDSKEKEHRISNLKDMINNMKKDEPVEIEEMEEDAELINYLNEESYEFGDLEIDDEFIYHPGDEKGNAINLEENPINEDFIINAPKTEDDDEVSEVSEVDGFFDDFAEGMGENFDNIINAKIGKTPVLAIVSAIAGAICLIIAGLVFNGRSDRVIDNVISGENHFIVVIFLLIGILLLAYGLYKILGIKNPVSDITDSINSIEKEKESKTNKKEENEEKIIPKSNIPLDKDSYKIGEFNMSDIKNKLKRQKTISKPKTIKTEDKLDEIPPAREKSKENENLTIEEIEEIEYNQVFLESETIDDIFADVEDIDDIEIISINSNEEKKE